VFRCDMILADTTYGGQLNVPDMFTRMMLSLVATGIAPYSFYELDPEGNRQRAHYDGLPVEFIADAMSTLGVNVVAGYETYHVMNPYDDGISMDTYVDWLVEAGYHIARVPEYADWSARFEMAARPARQAAPSVSAAAAAQLPEARTSDQRVTGAYGPLPGGRAGQQDRAGKGHPACLRAGDRQVHHRPGAARLALTG
jgi:fatty acid CoA ligase FadD9